MSITESSKKMRVSFDLDEVLFVCKETHKTEEELRFPYNKIYKERLRLGTNKLQDLTEEEIKLVTGGGIDFYLTYFITGPCGFQAEIRKNSNKCTECNICSHTNVECCK